MTAWLALRLTGVWHGLSSTLPQEVHYIPGSPGTLRADSFRGRCLFFFLTIVLLQTTAQAKFEKLSLLDYILTVISPQEQAYVHMHTQTHTHPMCLCTYIQACEYPKPSLPTPDYIWRHHPSKGNSPHPWQPQEATAGC